MADESREGRGRLSSIDLLPDEAEPDIVWALGELRDRKMPGKAIYAEFNARLADRGIAGVSKSAWSRYSVRRAIQYRKQDEVRRMSTELVASLGSDGSDQVTVMIAEMIKAQIFQLVEGGEVGTKDVLEMARALQSVVSSQRGSEEYRAKLEKRHAAQREQAADKVEAVAREHGLSAETIAQMRREFLGVQL